VSNRAITYSVLTANRLSDGIAVFLDRNGEWSESLAEAMVARSPDAVLTLESRGSRDAVQNLVVEPYLVEVQELAGRLVPVRFRERVRAGGPTILDDVPGYAAPAAVVRQAHPEDADRGQLEQPRAEPVEARRNVMPAGAA
jgi:hypothetical protein